MTDPFPAAFARLEQIMRHHDPAHVRRLTAIHDLPPDPDPAAHRDRTTITDLWRGLTA